MSVSKIKKLEEKQEKNKGMMSVISSLARIWNISDTCIPDVVSYGKYKFSIFW